MKKKVLIITAHFYPENFRINDVAVDLTNKGYQVEVLTGYPDYPHPKDFEHLKRSPLENWNEIGIHRFTSISRGDGKALRRVLNYLSFVVCCAWAGWTRKLTRPDVIMVWASSPITVAIPAIWLKKKFRVPLAIWVQDLWPETLQETGILPAGRTIQIFGRLVGWIYKNCDLIWCQSEGFRNSILNWNWQPEKTRVLYNWGDEAQLSIKPDLPADQRFKVLFAGNLGQVQCLEQQLRILELLKNEPILWTWIGGGSEEHWLREQIMIRDLNSCAQVLDRVSPSVVRHYGDWADVLIVALQSGPALSQTIPSKLQTYMFWKKPILGLTDGEAARIINEAQCGFASSPADPDSFADALRKFMQTSPEDLQTYGENALHYYQGHFPKRKILDILEANLNSLME